MSDTTKPPLRARLTFFITFTVIETWALTVGAGFIHAEVLPDLYPFGWPVALIILSLGRLLGVFDIPRYEEAFGT